MNRLLSYWLRSISWCIRPPNQIQKSLFALVAAWMTVVSITVTLWNWNMTSSTEVDSSSDLTSGISVQRLRKIIGKVPDEHAGLGNEMFVYSSVLGIAESNRMIPVVYSKQLGQVFDVTAVAQKVNRQVNVSVSSTDDLIDGFSTSVSETSPCIHDYALSRLSKIYPFGDVTIVGYLQSWKYFRFIETRIREEFTFKPILQLLATEFLRNASSMNRLSGEVTYVGVHIRRGDMTTKYNRLAGYTVADVTYLERAVIYITEKVLNTTSRSRHRNIVFVVCTDDGFWTNKYFPVAVQLANVVLSRQYGASANEVSPTGFADNLLDVFGFKRNIEREVTTSYNFTIVYSTGHSAWEDMAILSHCNHTIVTVGTFGWWAGFLSGGITVYYKSFPAAGSELGLGFYAEDYFLPEWVAL